MAGATIARAGLAGMLAACGLMLAPRPASAQPEVYILTADHRLAIVHPGGGLFLSNALPIVGLPPDERLVGIDIRPSTGEMYALGRSSRLYRIARASTTGDAAAAAIATGPFSPALSGTAFGFDFDPVSDRIRVVSDTGQNLQLSPDTGLVVLVDAVLNPPGHVTGLAYSNNRAGETATTPFGVDSASDRLVRIGGPDGVPPADLGGVTPVGPLGVNPTGDVGLDIDAFDGAAFATLRVNGGHGLYRIDLSSGAATLVGSLNSEILGVAIDHRPVTLWAVDDRHHLLRVNSAAPATVLSSTPITGLRTGESIVAIDARPATGQLYALANTSRLFTIDLLTGAASAVGVGTLTTPLSGTAFGFDVDPVADRIRIVTDTGQNLRVDPDTAGVVALDGSLSPSSAVTAAAYTNNVAGSAATTLFGIDTARDRLVRLGGVDGAPPPDAGTITDIGALGADASAVAGFDIDAAANAAVATLTVDGASALYRIDLATGAASPVGTIGAAATRTVAIATALPGRLQFARSASSASEFENPVITVTRTGGADGVVTVGVATIDGTAQAGGDYVAAIETLVFRSGETRKELRLAIVQDTIPEPAEMLTVALSAPTGGASLATPAVTTIILVDDDEPMALPPPVIITDPTTEPALTVTSALLQLGVTVGGRAQSVSWENDRGGRGVLLQDSWYAWKVDEIFLFPGTNVITVTATTANGAEATDTLTVALADTTYHLAEGATGIFFDTDIAIANPNAAVARVSLTFLSERGLRWWAEDPRTRVTRTVDLALGPMARTTVSVDAQAGLESRPFSTVVASTDGLPLVVERTMRWDGTAYGSHGEKAVAGPSRTWYFAEGAQGFFETFLLLANPVKTANRAMVRFLIEGAEPLEKFFALAALSRTTVYLGGLPELVGRSFGIEVRLDEPGFAERATYFGIDPFLSGGHASAGSQQVSSTWYFAEGATGPFFETFVLLVNPNDEPATVVLTFLRTNGPPLARTKHVPANSRLTVNIEAEDPSLANAAVATAVTADRPVVAERSMYWPDSAASWYEGHCSVGLAEAATDWGLAEGQSGGPDSSETYILLANPGVTAAEVTVTFLRTSGPPIVRTLTVMPSSRLSVRVHTLVPELLNERFGASIRSTVPIVVERSLYGSPGGVAWASGSNVTGTPRR